MPRGGKREGAGAKKDPRARRAALQVRVDADRLDAYRAAALAEGTTVSEKVRDYLDQWSERVLKR